MFYLFTSALNSKQFPALFDLFHHFLNMVRQCSCGAEDCPLHVWAHPWRKRVNSLKKWGLDCETKVRIQADGFVCVDVFVKEHDRWLMLRDSTRWQKHISLGYLEEFTAEDVVALKRLWHCRFTHLSFSAVTVGGTMVLGVCPLTQCRVFRRMKRVGYYSYSDPHISF
jgi:hypothetical protein